MKKQVLIGSVLLAAISAFPQSGRLKPQSTNLINTKMLAAYKFGADANSPNLSVPITAVPSAVPSSNGSEARTSAINNTWNNFTASMNIYGVIIGYCKPLQWNDELNAVSFVHRKSPSYSPSPTPASNAANGSIVAMISQNCGGTWDSTAIWANDNFWGRYPGGAIYNPPSTPSNTNINNAYIVGSGPTTGNGSATWIGNWYASKQLGQVNYDNVPSTTPNAQQVMPTGGPYTPNLGRHDFAAYGFTATDDGKVRTLAGVTDDALAADTAVMLVTGTFNSTSGTFDWAGRVFNPPTTIQPSDGTENWISRPMMAWNEDGTVGYVVIIGSRIGATGSNVGFQPIVYKTTNSGGSWNLEVGINFNSAAFADVKRSIVSVATDSTLEVPFFNWIENIDCAVDANNKLHIFSSIIGHTSNNPDSLGFIQPFTSEGYLWPHTPGFQPYLYDFIYDGTNATPSWSHVLVDSMSSEGPAGVSTGNGYQDNPWDQDPTQSNQKVRIDSRLQMSRTPDGQYIVYTWAESDTAFTNGQKKWNVLPNVKARVMKVSTGTIHPAEINITSGYAGANGDVANRAMYHFVSPKCRLASTNTTNGPAITMPVTVSNSTPYSQLTGNSHWFSWAVLNFGNVPDAQITLCGASPTQTTVTGISENTANLNNSFLYPNPAKSNVIVGMNLSNNAKVQIQVLNTIGQVVKTTKADGQAGSNEFNVDLSGLSSGIYMVNIKADNISSTKKLVIE